MGHPVITVDNLGKKYLLTRKRFAGQRTLRDVLTSGAREFSRKVGRIVASSSSQLESEKGEEFWALKEVSFTVEQGERVGIIGRNGAGKTTLLKILSRITEPTEGKARIRGRVASLLEVGTGFHPELTGRENIYLNGAILGLRRGDISKRFNEIVAFADVEKFLDIPIKRYSSGMFVRLAFAVAAHLDPDILLVDEVLAVGDAEFQKKCLGKMEEIGQSGRTIIFVSHNMNSIERLCEKAILLDGGKLVACSDNVRSVIRKYLVDPESFEGESEWKNPGKAFENTYFKPLRFGVVDKEGEKLSMPVRNDSDMWVHVEAEIQTLDPSITFGYALYSEDGTLLYWSYQTDQEESLWPDLEKGVSVFRSRIPPRLLNEGSYSLYLLASLHFREWICEPLVNSPSIRLTIQGGLSSSPYWIMKRPGMIAPVMKWVRVD